MALADKSWTTPQLLFKLAFQAKSRVLYGSWFLWCAIGLVVLGVSLNPLQTALTSPQTIAVPTRLHQVDQQQADIPQRFDENTGADDGYTVAMTRSRLATAKNTDTQMRLWSSNPNITAEEFDRGCDDREKSLILRYHNFTSEIEANLLSTAAGYFTLPNSTNNYVDLSLMDPHENPVDRCKDSPTCATQDKSKRANHLPRNMSMPATASFDITAIGENKDMVTVTVVYISAQKYFQ
ncbi:restless-like transposase [Purpureocillium lavendulum]|uniref:Restless-like transposase n=1 Tax=Purpureocillium lavendulum TaxID=1247861 RepID=A0AB34G0C5_9HYPO|nr:restless-like transposase [Purpureocillium lavendulum]